MQSRRLHRIEPFHALGMPESERLEVTALNLFHTSPSPLVGEGKGEGELQIGRY